MKERQLDYREDSTIRVEMKWHPDLADYITVEVEYEGRDFWLVPKSGKEAIDMFNHPMAYVAQWT